ncbi:hypothetical protein [Microbulbifer sp. ZKSA002]|uniref:hypothetical protein n=1 Tax=Microbulbifer sp. ZKSA002 TaxID=3243388 RepID=UPI0040397DED
MAIFGVNPIEGSNNSVMFGRIIVDIKKTLKKIVDNPSALNDPDNGFVACIYALRVLAEAEPERAHSSIYKGQVEEWEKLFFESLDKSRKLPAKYREGFLQSAKDNFGILKSIGSDMPRDMW